VKGLLYVPTLVREMYLWINDTRAARIETIRLSPYLPKALVKRSLNSFAAARLRYLQQNSPLGNKIRAWQINWNKLGGHNKDGEIQRAL
jgi:hypothetical protein